MNVDNLKSFAQEYLKQFVLGFIVIGFLHFLYDYVFNYKEFSIERVLIRTAMFALIFTLWALYKQKKQTQNEQD